MRPRIAPSTMIDEGTTRRSRRVRPRRVHRADRRVASPRRWRRRAPVAPPVQGRAAGSTGAGTGGRRGRGVVSAPSRDRRRRLRRAGPVAAGPVGAGRGPVAERRAATLARKTGRRRSSRSTSSVIEPSKRISPRSRKMARSRQGHGTVDALLDQDHGRPVGVDAPDDLHEALDRHGGETEGELVDHEQARLGHHDPGQGQHLLLAARQRARRLVETVLELGEQRHGFVQGGLGPRRCRGGTCARRCAGSRGR